MEDFRNIPIEIEGKNQLFNYNYLEEDKSARICIIDSEGKTLVIDEKYAVISTDMPGNWVDPAINTLRNLLLKDIGMP